MFHHYNFHEQPSSSAFASFFGGGRIKESNISILDFSGAIKLQRLVFNLSVLIEKFKENMFWKNLW